MAEYLIQSETLDDIVDAINAKTGGSSDMTPAEMVTAIGSISGGGGIQSASGEIVLASADSVTKLLVSGLPFKPNAFIVISHPTENTKTVGGYAFCGLFEMWIRINADGQKSQRNMIVKESDIPNDTFSFDGLGDGNDSTYYHFYNDGFRLNPAVSSYTFQPGISYYWKAWRFE